MSEELNYKEIVERSVSLLWKHGWACTEEHNLSMKILQIVKEYEEMEKQLGDIHKILRGDI